MIHESQKYKIYGAVKYDCMTSYEPHAVGLQNSLTFNILLSWGSVKLHLYVCWSYLSPKILINVQWNLVSRLTSVMNWNIKISSEILKSLEKSRNCRRNLQIFTEIPKSFVKSRDFEISYTHYFEECRNPRVNWTAHCTVSIAWLYKFATCTLAIANAPRILHCSASLLYIGIVGRIWKEARETRAGETSWSHK